MFHKVYKSKIVKVLKKHECAICGKKIPNSNTATNITYSYDKRLISIYCCTSCEINNSDSQKELIDLQIENNKLKERIESINEYLDTVISGCDIKAKEFFKADMKFAEMGSSSMQIAYQNVKEFIKNQK